jgi:alkyldihydroxyacetonephosphate synthase
MPDDPIQPRWLRQPPPEDSYRSIFKWGAPGRFHDPRPGLVRLIQHHLGFARQDWHTPRHTGLTPVRAPAPRRLAAGHVQHLTALVGPENVQTDDYARVRYAHGQSAEEILRLRHGRPACATDLVLHPRHKEDVGAIVGYCNQARIPVTPYGGGSSVTLGLRPDRGGVTLAMGTHMHRVLAFNETNQTITVEPGLMGPAYEDCLNRAPEHFKARRRYTGGHFPQSFEFSTVGGWIAALGAGQQSTYYGDMYDLVVSQTYVTPAGTIETADYPATATGPKVNDILKGSEGAFGVLVAATLKIFRWAPRSRRTFAYMLPTWPAAVQAAREISQGEFGLPSVLRISDPEETEAAIQMYGPGKPFINTTLRWRGLHPMRRCLLIGQSDGQKQFARNVARQSGGICRRLKGLWLSGYPVRRWAHSRFLDPYLRDDLFDMGVLIDTLETAVPWDRLETVHTGVREYIKARPRTLCMTHASHFYPQGTNLYFIFITPMPALEDYRAFQHGVIAQIIACGGSLSHHHGVGKLMGPLMERHLGKAQMDVLRALKQHFDPHGIMNPGGTLGLG